MSRLYIGYLKDETQSKSAFSLTTPKLEVIPRNQSQEDFINSISSHDISFGIGPAGTGKTYLAVAVAVNAKRDAAK